MSGDPAERWLPFRAGAWPRFRLLCLPHAGAGATVYRSWGTGLEPGIEVWPVQLPGRESRVFEEPYHRMDALVHDLAQALRGIAGAPYALFGHSLGALVAFELARQIRRADGRAPAHLFVSGCRAPHLPSGLPALHDLPAPELAAALHALGGTPQTVLDDPVLFKALAPMLRADFAVYETYRHRAGPPLETPITAFAAAADRRAGRDEVAAWRSHTRGEFQFHLLPGGHFSVLEHRSFVHARISEALKCHV